jgi:hypothetical protein
MITRPGVASAVVRADDDRNGRSWRGPVAARFLPSRRHPLVRSGLHITRRLAKGPTRGPVDCVARLPVVQPSQGRVLSFLAGALGLDRCRDRHFVSTSSISYAQHKCQVAQHAAVVATRAQFKILS